MSVNNTIRARTIRRIYRVYYNCKSCGLVNSHACSLGLTTIGIRHHNGVMRSRGGRKIGELTRSTGRCGAV